MRRGVFVILGRNNPALIALDCDAIQVKHARDPVIEPRSVQFTYLHCYLPIDRNHLTATVLLRAVNGGNLVPTNIFWWEPKWSRLWMARTGCRRVSARTFRANSNGNWLNRPLSRELPYRWSRVVTTLIPTWYSNGVANIFR